MPMMILQLPVGVRIDPLFYLIMLPRSATNPPRWEKQPPYQYCALTGIK